MASGDLLGMIRPGGQPVIRLPVLPAPDGLAGVGPGVAPAQVHGTTVIAVKYRGGVINVGDRRATANFAVMYDRAEKVLAIDDFTLLAISGSYARALEVVRYLRHSFRYFERSQLQPMSLDGKLSELARVVAAGVPAMMQGIGGFIPLLSTYDRQADEGRIFFYDGLGARFESTEFAAAGSGSIQIRGVFDYIVKARGPFHEMERDEALTQALLLLDIAADLDAATGGWAKVLPLAKTIGEEGIADVPDDELRHIVSAIDNKETLR